MSWRGDEFSRQARWMPPATGAVVPFVDLMRRLSVTMTAPTRERVQSARVATTLAMDRK